MSFATDNIDRAVAANAAYAATLTPADKALEIPPAKKYAIVTCIDARVHPVSALGVGLGDAHIMRNAGGSARDALRSLIISQQVLGTEEILVIKHTDCGMLKFTDEQIYELLGEKAEPARKELKDGFHTFPELEEEVKRDVEFLRGSELIKGTKVSGWVYDVRSGKIERVV